MAATPADYRGHVLKNIVEMPYSPFMWTPSFKENEYIGMEIEAEGVNLPGPENIRYLWSAKEDGSLRKTPVSDPSESPHPWEYVLKRPVSPAVCVNKALPYLQAQMEKRNSRLNFTGRCSVHVHVGVHELRMYQIFAMVGIYYLFEELIQPLFGKDRQGNLFCIGSLETPLIMDNVVKDAAKCFPSNKPHNKYTAVNLLTLYSLGTVEFRGMEGTLNKERLEIWLDILDKIRSYAKTLTGDKMAFMLNTMSLQGPSAMMVSIFPEGSPSHTQLMKTAAKFGGAARLDSILYRGIARVQALFYEHDWASVKDSDEVFLKSSSSPKKKMSSLGAPTDFYASHGLTVPQAFPQSWSTTGSTETPEAIDHDSDEEDY